MSELAVAVDPLTALTGAHDAPWSSRRLKRTTVCLPIVHGSISFYLGKKADEFQSHQWTLYLRGPNNEDLSHCIQKLVFQLHASFPQPVREYTQPPFEVTEKGWGEFEAQIRIHWKDPAEKTTMVRDRSWLLKLNLIYTNLLTHSPTVLSLQTHQVTHGIKLYPPGTPANAAPTSTEIPVVAETYDEVVFTDPHESFFQQLQAVREAPSVETEYSQHKHFTKFSDTDDVHALLEAQKFLHQQLRDAKERLKNVDDDLAEVGDGLLANHEQQQLRAAAVAVGTIASKPTPKTSNKHKASSAVGATGGPKGSPGKKAKHK
jgi:YEATS domain-containing protein 4